MALDRFVHFPELHPSWHHVVKVLENFFNGSAKIEWRENRFYVTLPGESKFAFNGIYVGRQCPREERWIEVVPGPVLDIITREQDEYTNVLADGLAKLFARRWDGHIDDGTGRIELDVREAKIVRECVRLLDDQPGLTEVFPDEGQEIIDKVREKFQ